MLAFPRTDVAAADILHASGQFCTSSKSALRIEVVWGPTAVEAGPDLCKFVGGVEKADRNSNTGVRRHDTSFDRVPGSSCCLKAASTEERPASTAKIPSFLPGILLLAYFSGPDGRSFQRSVNT